MKKIGELSTENLEIEKLKSTLKTQSDLIMKNMLELDTVNNQIKLLKTEIQTGELQNKQLQDTNSCLKNQITEYKSRIDSQTEVYENLVKSEATYKQQNENLTNEKNQLDSFVRNKNVENEKLTNDLADLESQVKILENENRQLEKEKNAAIKAANSGSSSNSNSISASAASLISSPAPQIRKITVDKACTASIELPQKPVVVESPKIDDSATRKVMQDKIDKMTKNYQDEKKAHMELKTYLDKILMNIMMKDPTLLEV